MVFGTILILYSSSILLTVVFSVDFREFAKPIKPDQYCIQLPMLSLVCLGANKGLHDSSVEKMIMFAFACWDWIVSSFTG